MDTLLDIVQDLLSAMDSDEVNNISDTTESLQVARLVRGVFYDCASYLNLEEHDSLIELSPSNDLTKPVLMSVPSNVAKVLWIKYNHKLFTDPQNKYVDIEYVPFFDFYQEQTNLSDDTEGLASMDINMNGENFELKYLTNAMPKRYTYIKNNVILFDSFDMSQDSTLQKSKTLCGGRVYPVFELEDDFVPPFDPAQMSYFKNKCKTRAFYELKQTENREAAGEARRQQTIIQTNKNRLPDESAIVRQKRITGYGR